MGNRAEFSPPPEEFPRRSEEYERAALTPTPEECVRPAASVTPEEFAAPPAPPAKRKASSFRNLIVAILALTAVTSAAGVGRKPVTPVSVEASAIVSLASVPAPATPDPLAGLTDAQILLQYGTWAAGCGVTATFRPDGTGWWYDGHTYGLLTWTADAAGHVSYTGSATNFYNPPIAYDQDGNETSPESSYTASGAVTVSRDGPEITLENPLNAPCTLYAPGTDDSGAWIADWAGKPMREVLAGALWVPADGLTDGIQSIETRADGTLLLTLDGQTAEASREDQGDWWFFCNCTSAVQVGDKTWTQVLFSVFLNYSGDGPRLFLFDPFSSVYDTREFKLSS